MHYLQRNRPNLSNLLSKSPTALILGLAWWVRRTMDNTEEVSNIMIEVSGFHKISLQESIILVLYLILIQRFHR